LHQVGDLFEMFVIHCKRLVHLNCGYSNCRYNSQ